MQSHVCKRAKTSYIDFNIAHYIETLWLFFNMKVSGGLHPQPPKKPLIVRIALKLCNHVVLCICTVYLTRAIPSSQRSRQCRMKVSKWSKTDNNGYNDKQTWVGRTLIKLYLNLISLWIDITLLYYMKYYCQFSICK